jgi:hypothetical protein
LSLLAIAALGYDPQLVRNLLSTPVAAVPALVGVYLLGIILDRLADSTLHIFRADRKCLKYFPSEDESLR